MFRHYKLPSKLEEIRIGEFIVVRSLIDKTQEDLGVVTQIYTSSEFDALLARLGPSEDADENKIGRVLRIAQSEERELLPLKHKKEQPILNVCQAFVQRNQMPMTVYGVEYQFDGKIMFVYYLSKDRVDFRPLVKFLIKTYCTDTRVQMRKTNQRRTFLPYDFAAKQLVTGVYYEINNTRLSPAVSMGNNIGVSY